jgi:peptide deformylase
LALRTIRTFDDEILRKPCRPVKEVTDRIRTLIEDMVETMAQKDGGGLAANQVGILRRVVVIDIADSGLLKLINPEIVSSEGTAVVEEGCLSFPDVWGTVERPEKVTVRALDENGNEFEVSGEGLLAQCLSHEIDHLNGIVFTDKVIEYIDPYAEDEDDADLQAGEKTEPDEQA